MRDSIKVAFVTDQNYFKPMSVAIESIVRNTHENIHCYVIDLGISDKQKNDISNRYINQNVTIEYIKLKNKKISSYSLKTHVSSAAYSKIYLSELIKEKKVIYLDCDVILNTDIQHLWNKFEPECIVKAVWNPFYNYDNEFLGITDNRRTFNSGVMLLNLESMRNQKSSVKLEYFLTEFHNKTKLHDQAAFNAIFKDDWKELDLKWNYQNSMIRNSYRKLNLNKKDYFKLYNSPSIIHFTSNSKPWHWRNYHPFKKQYAEYYSRLYGKISYSDMNFKSSLKKVKELINYKSCYLKNLLV